MGLDMYLTAEKYVYDEEHAALSSALAKAGFNYKNKSVRSISIEIMTWRKANQIHRWFVEHVQKGDDDCKRYYVSLEKIKLLVEICKTVLVERTQASLLLPTREGFFFGSYEYDDMYFEDVTETLECLAPVINDKSWQNWDFYYQSSW